MPFQRPARIEINRTSVAGQATDATADLAPNLALPWVVRLRYGMVPESWASFWECRTGFNSNFPFSWTLAPFAIVLASNILLARLRVLPLRFSQETLGAVFCLDTLCLTAMLGLTGGPMNPFSLLYLVQITLSAVVLRKVWTWALGVSFDGLFRSAVLLPYPFGSVSDPS